MSGALARNAPDTNWRWSYVRDNQTRDQLEAFFGYISRAGVLRGGKVTKTAANEVSLEANTVIGSKGVAWDIGNNVTDPGPPPVLLGANPLPRTVAGTPSTNLYLYAQLVRTPTTDPIAYTVPDSYAVVLTYSASATPADDEHIPLAVIPLDGSGNITGSIGDVMPAPAGPKYLHGWPNVGYRNVPIPGTGVFTPTSDDLAVAGWELSGILTGNRQVEIAPEAGRFVLVLNSTTGAFTVTIRTPGTAGIVLTRNTAALLWLSPAGVIVIATTDLALLAAADGVTLEVNANTLRVKDAGITAAKLATGSVTSIKRADAVAAKAANYAALVSDEWLFVDSTSGDVTITLPAANACPHPIGIKKIVAGHNVIVARAGADLIDGATSKTLTAQYESYLFVPNGVDGWGIW